MKVLQLDKLHDEAQELLDNNFDVVGIEDTFNSNEIEAVVLRTFSSFKRERMDKYSNLKYVIQCSVGVDNLDLDEIARRGIKLMHVPGTNSNSVAEHTMFLMLSLFRSKAPFFELKGKTVGIVGFGQIGKIVARKLLGFECKVIAFDVIEQDVAILKELGVEMCDMSCVLEKSDVVSVHVPLNKYTHNLIGAKEFALMKKESFFINTSRSEIVEEDALLDSLDQFRGVGLDVDSDKLKNKEKVINTMHVAAQGEDSFRLQCAKPIEKFLKDIGKI
jgi:lactate dehydrogenase-like 2-hydroxyacid dehydrogenase